MAESHAVYLSLGSNQGDRKGGLERAFRRLSETAGVVAGRLSSFWETDPVGGPPGQGMFLNAACGLSVSLEPLELLDLLQAMEREAGRDREGDRVRWGPRPLDLDIVLWGGRTIDLPRLRVPHPLMAVRRFVLLPLAEIAPDVRHPESGKTVRELLAALDGGGS